MGDKEQGLIKLQSNIKKAADNLIIAATSLKSCYVENAAPLDKFMILREKVTNDAKVYSIKVLPFSIMVIENIQKFFKYYNNDNFTLEKFKKYIKLLAKEAEKNEKVCEYTVELHICLLADLKKRKDDATEVLGELGLEAEKLEEDIKKFKKEHKHAKTWAISLAFVPYVNVIASPIIGVAAHKAKVKAIAAGENRKITAAAAKCIQESLIVSVEKFIEAISEISGYFNVLTSNLKQLNENFQFDPEDSDEEIEFYFDMFKQSSPKIENSCEIFIKNIPICKAELDSIPIEHNQNYVQKWLSTRLESKGEKSLINWGLEIFKDNKKMLKFLEA